MEIKKMKDELGDRIKSYYEGPYRIHIPMKIPIIIRLDGRNFHNFTKDCNKPFDEKIITAMDNIAINLCKEIPGALLAYTQSDEISILVKNYSSIDQQAWFKNNLQKIVSVSSSIASSLMTMESVNIFGEMRLATFDSRIFILPEFEVNNYFIWRQNEASRNSIQMLARSIFSHKKCDDKKISELQEMCKEKGHNWNSLPTHLQIGRSITKIFLDVESVDKKSGKTIKFQKGNWVVDKEIPLFSKNKNYINNLFDLSKDSVESEDQLLINVLRNGSNEDKVAALTAAGILINSTDIDNLIFSESA